MDEKALEADWADDGARFLFDAAFGPHGSPGTMGRQLREDIAEALREAHKAGMEEAAGIADSHTVYHGGFGPKIATAIRKASETDDD